MTLKIQILTISLIVSKIKNTEVTIIERTKKVTKLQSKHTDPSSCPRISLEIASCQKSTRKYECDQMAQSEIATASQRRGWWQSIFHASLL